MGNGATKLASTVHSDPEVMHGTPVFKGTRVSVKTLFDYVEAGDSLERFNSDGYSKGVGERHEQTSYRSRHSSHSGYRSYVSVTDLVGARASGAESDLRSRGFSTTGGYKQRSRSIATWWNGRTRQCVQVVTRQGRIDSIESIAEGNCL